VFFYHEIGKPGYISARNSVVKKIQMQYVLKGIDENAKGIDRYKKHCRGFVFHVF
jgi:hypothetical protein